jgi:hypothetical protein
MISRLSRLSRWLKADKYIQIPENCKRHGKRHGKRRGMLGTEPDCYGHSAPWHWGPHQAPWRGACAQMSWNHVKSCEIMWNLEEYLEVPHFLGSNSRSEPQELKALGGHRRCLRWKEKGGRCNSVSVWTEVALHNRKSIASIHCIHKSSQIYRSYSTYEMAGRSKWHLTCSLAHIFFACTYSSFCWIISSSCLSGARINLLQTLWLHEDQPKDEFLRLKQRVWSLGFFGDVATWKIWKTRPPRVPQSSGVKLFKLGTQTPSSSKRISLKLLDDKCKPPSHRGTPKYPDVYAWKTGVYKD